MSVARCRQQGLALVVVLWATALMTLLAASFAFSMRTEARLAATSSDRARAAAAAEAGLVRLQAVLLSRDRRTRGAVAGRMQFDGLEVDLEARPENARVDLNAAPPALLLGLLTEVMSTVEPEGSPTAVAEAVLDWRDADDDRRDQGAEARDYEHAGLAARPRNGAFLSVTELAGVKGVSPALYEALRPLLTVYAWSPQVDALNADPAVLRGLPGVEAAQVEAFLEAREEGAASLSLLAGAVRYVARAPGAVYSLTARARAPSGLVAGRRMVVKLGANPRQPPAVLAWFADADPGAPAVDAGDTAREAR